MAGLRRAPPPKTSPFDLNTLVLDLCFVGCAFSRAKTTQNYIDKMTNQDELQERPSLWRDEDGTTAVEYAVMIALIIAVCIGSVGTLTDETNKSFQASGEAIAGAMGN